MFFSFPNYVIPEGFIGDPLLRHGFPAKKLPSSIREEKPAWMRRMKLLRLLIPSLK
jgi:hypothetical protein